MTVQRIYNSPDKNTVQVRKHTLYYNMLHKIHNNIYANVYTHP